MSAFSIRELLEYLDRVEPNLDKLNLFELLDIAVGADGDSIQDSFHRLAGRLHPDRYRHDVKPEDHDRLTTVYARIASAYTVLRDPKQRDAYLAKLARDDDGKGASETSALSLLSPKAQRYYRRARAALGTNDVHSALLNLRMALASDRNSALLKRALADAEAKLASE